MPNIFVINLGGSSSKIAVYDGKKCVLEKSLQHTQQEMADHPLSEEQVTYRVDVILKWMDKNQISISNIDAFGLRATPIKEAIHGGTYLIAGRYRELVMQQYFPEKKPVHGTRIAVPLAEKLAGGREIPMYVTDPGGSNELPPVARVTGLKEYTRYPTCHALNQKAVARKYAESKGRKYENCRLVVVHLGSGISVGAHRDGGIVDVNEAGEGYGPFAPLRAGTIESRIMLELCFDHGLTKDQVRHKIRNQAGVLSHLGTDDMREVERRIQEGDEYALLILEAMAYQIAKSVGARVAVLCGKADAIIITGAIAHSKLLVSKIRKYVETFAPIAVFPGEFESEALALGAYRVMTGQEVLQSISEEV